MNAAEQTIGAIIDNAPVIQPRPKEVLGLAASMRTAEADRGRLVSVAHDFGNESPQMLVPKRSPLDWTALDGKSPPPREWILPGWIPHNHTTLLAGRGGVGKTLLAQHFATAIASGLDYLGPAPTRRVLMWAGEDDHRELWHRQQNICSYMHLRMESLSGNFILLSYAGADITLVAPIYNHLAPTPMLEELRQQVLDHKPDLVILDNVARLFGGNENDRHAVTTFVALVQGVCAPAAVLLLGHPAKSQGSEYSGSTAWEGAVRTRQYLSDRPPDVKGEPDEPPADDRVRYLSRRKANYSALDLRRFKLEEGVLIPDVVDPTKTFTPSGEFARDIVRKAIQSLANRGLYGALGQSSPNYLPRLAARGGLLEQLSQKQFAGVMFSMVMDGEVENRVVGQYGNRTKKYGLALK